MKITDLGTHGGASHALCESGGGRRFRIIKETAQWQMVATLQARVIDEHLPAGQIGGAPGRAAIYDERFVISRMTLAAGQSMTMPGLTFWQPHPQNRLLRRAPAPFAHIPLAGECIYTNFHLADEAAEVAAYLEGADYPHAARNETECAAGEREWLTGSPDGQMRYRICANTNTAHADLAREWTLALPLRIEAITDFSMLCIAGCEGTPRFRACHHIVPPDGQLTIPQDGWLSATGEIQAAGKTLRADAIHRITAGTHSGIAGISVLHLCDVG